VGVRENPVNVTDAPAQSMKMKEREMPAALPHPKTTPSAVAGGYSKRVMS